MSRKYVYICSNPKCKTSLFLGSFEKKAACPDCGSLLYVVCPHCSLPFDRVGQTFCINCTKKIKDQPSSATE